MSHSFVLIDVLELQLIKKILSNALSYFLKRNFHCSFSCYCLKVISVSK